MKGIIEIKFKEKCNDILYNGESYIRKNLIDHVEIRKNSIKLNFERKNIKNDILETSRSYVRTELQKALTFYLVTMGEFKDIKKVIFIVDKNNLTEESDFIFSKLYTLTHGCKLEFTIDPQYCENMFKGAEYKRLYATITYFIKAQLCAFDNDAFRYAWTAFNSVYNGDASVQTRECEKLKNFEILLLKQNFSNSLKYIESINDDFYNKLNWYYFCKNNNMKINEFMCVNNYNDSILLKNFKDGFSILKHNENNDYESCCRRVKNTISKNIKTDRDRLKFLVCSYSYMLRNRMFHGAKDYILFPMFDVETHEEGILYKLILNVIIDALSLEIFK